MSTRYVNSDEEYDNLFPGIATGVTTLYISEISPVSVKGGVGVSHQFMITFGILVGFILSINKVVTNRGILSIYGLFAVMDLS